MLLIVLALDPLSCLPPTLLAEEHGTASPKWELGGPASPCGAARRYITAQVSKPVRGEWQASRADMQRAAVSMLVMIAWFGIQFTSDYTHLIGQLKPTEKRNPYWPLPELSMFADPRRHGAAPDFRVSGALVVCSLLAFLSKVAFEGATLASLDRVSTAELKAGAVIGAWSIA